MERLNHTRGRNYQRAEAKRLTHNLSMCIEQSNNGTKVDVLISSSVGPADLDRWYPTPVFHYQRQWFPFNR